MFRHLINPFVQKKIKKYRKNEMQDNAIEILPNLFLGPYESAKDLQWTKQKNISVIVNCSKDLKDEFGLNLTKPIEEAPKEVQDWLLENSFYIQYFRIPVDDQVRSSEMDNFVKHTNEILPKIIELYNKKQPILVHCLAGNQRSPAFVVALLMKLLNIPLNEAIKKVLQKKPNVFFFGSDIHFMEALQKL